MRPARFPPTRSKSFGAQGANDFGICLTRTFDDEDIVNGGAADGRGRGPSRNRRHTSEEIGGFTRNRVMPA
jgi:hypothetical protein